MRQTNLSLIIIIICMIASFPSQAQEKYLPTILIFRSAVLPGPKLLVRFILNATRMYVPAPFPIVIDLKYSSRQEVIILILQQISTESDEYPGFYMSGMG